MAPRFDILRAQEMRRPLHEINGTQSDYGGRGQSGKHHDRGAGDADGGRGRPDSATGAGRGGRVQEEPEDFYLGDLLTQLTSVLGTKPSDKPTALDGDAEDPASVPIYWVSKWVDYSDKYGLGYQLCDNSVGVLFNDSTRLLLLQNGEDVQYIERDGREHFHTLSLYPEDLQKKVTLLKYFRNYMSEHLLKAGANMTPRDGDDLSRLPFLRTWFRTRSGIILHLSNGTLQLNFFQDHTKIIICPLMGACTYIDDRRESRTYRLQLVEQHGCCKELASRLRYARSMVERLIQNKSGSGRARSANVGGAQGEEAGATNKGAIAAPPVGGALGGGAPKV